MSKYSQVKQHKEERPWKIHPIWRGIGCFMMLLIPIMAFAAAKEFVSRPPSWFPYMTAEFQRPIVMAPINLDLYMFHIHFQPNFYGISPGDIIFTLVFMIVGFSFFTVGYALLYRIVGPRRYSAYDSPPIRRTRR